MPKNLVDSKTGYIHYIDSSPAKFMAEKVNDAELLNLVETILVGITDFDNSISKMIVLYNMVNPGENLNLTTAIPVILSEVARRWYNTMIAE